MSHSICMALIHTVQTCIAHAKILFEFQCEGFASKSLTKDPSLSLYLCSNTSYLDNFCYIILLHFFCKVICICLLIISASILTYLDLRQRYLIFFCKLYVSSSIFKSIFSWYFLLLMLVIRVGMYTCLYFDHAIRIRLEFGWSTKSYMVGVAYMK